MKMGYYLERGRYQFYHRGIPKGTPLDAVAIAIDEDTGRWFGHGDLANTMAKLTDYVLAQTGSPAPGNSYRIIHDRFTLDYLNRALLIAEFVPDFYAQVQARAHDTLDRAGNVIKGSGKLLSRAITPVAADQEPSVSRATMVAQLKKAYDKAYWTIPGVMGKLAMSAILVKALENGIRYEEIDPVYHLALR